jgi:hypothetical protein
MASLIDKLKTLFSAGARGPTQHRQEPETQAETEPPEVIEAPARRGKQPEVTEGQLRRRILRRDTAAEAPRDASRDASRLDAPRRRPEADEELEGGRVVDLLGDTGDEDTS